MRERFSTKFREIDHKTVGIELTWQLEAIIDTDCLDYFLGRNWFTDFDGKGRATPAAKINGRKVYMHHILVYPLSGYMVDHINRNPLDNRLVNLRLLSNQENVLNSERSDLAKCIYYNTRERKWKAWIKLPTWLKKCHLGTFKTEEEALQAVAKAKQELNS